MLSVAEYIAEFLERKGIDVIFQLSGGMTTQLIDAIAVKGKTRIVSLFHEQSCSFAASAHGRVLKKPTIALATSGPGATNLITGIGDCFFDSIPAIFITGQVNSYELKGELGIRQLGFQETNIIEMVTPIVKKAIQITDDDDISNVFEEMYNISISGRPGPVLIDIPMNLQRKKILTTDLAYIDETEKEINDSIDLGDFFNLIENSQRPLIWAGNGIHLDNMEEEFISFVNEIKIPCVMTLHGIDLIPSDSKYRVGMIGSYGNRWANKCVKDADLIIFIGSRIDIRQTGANLSIFENKKLIRIDCDNAEIQNRLKSNLSYLISIKSFLSAFGKLKHKKFPDFSSWINQINAYKIEYPLLKELNLPQKDLINPHEVIQLMSQKIESKVVYSVDVGAHQMWAAQSLFFKEFDRFITSGGMGSMGFSLPAAIGACLSNLFDQNIVIVGDGSFQMNIQELQFIYKENLNVKILLLNNESLGMIRQFQDSYMNSRYYGTQWGYSTPNFCKVAEAYGINSRTITFNNQIVEALDWFLLNNEPKLLEIKINSKLDVYPKIAFGQTMDKMEPDFKPVGIEST